MKYIIIFLLLNIHNLVYSQTETEDIIFKAKLLTTSKFGVKNSLQLIEEIKAQDHKAITLNEQKTYLLIKIYKNQDYKIELDNGVGSVFCGVNCTYWLAYSEYDKRFYKIGGFIENEIYLFLDHLSKSGEYETLFNLMTVDNFDIDDVIDYWSSDKKVGSPPRANTPLCDECDKAVKIY